MFRFWCFRFIPEISGNRSWQKDQRIRPLDDADAGNRLRRPEYLGARNNVSRDDFVKGCCAIRQFKECLVQRDQVCCLRIALRSHNPARELKRSDLKGT